MGARGQRDRRSTGKVLVGPIRIGGNGNGYFREIAEDRNSEIEIPSEFLATALHGDEVEIRVLARISNGKPQGEVARILHRNKMEFVGVLSRDRDTLTVTPDDTRMYRNIIVRRTKERAPLGMKVLVRILEWRSAHDDPQGEIVSVIGRPGLHETEVQAIALDRGFDGRFPARVEDEARRIPDIGPKDLRDRRDFRTTLTFTIDPKDAKDFDDALSWRELDNGRIEIGVHIADVSHYVRPGTMIDKEAAQRATSVYLVDRTIPMLPERLSNDLCSLRPDVDRLAFSAVFEMTPDGAVHKEWYGKTVIHSARRLTYEQAQEIIEGKRDPLSEPIASLDAIAKRLRAGRVAQGAIEFQAKEVKCELGPKGEVVRIYRKELKDANKLIEEFMLLANRKVTEWVGKHVPEEASVFVYRVHDEPNEDKLRDLDEFLRGVGVSLTTPGEKTSGRDINRMLEAVEHLAEKSYIHIASVRAMAKAIYSTKNIGHFGLGFTHYTHFTSPIRRYPDTMVHRLLDRYLRKERVDKKELEGYERMARYASEMEVSAAEAERASVRYKQVEYWSERMETPWTGTISGVAPWGIFIEETETGAEGMIHVRDLDDDMYTYEESKHRMVGNRTKRVFRLGDPIQARIRDVDLRRRLIALSLDEARGSIRR